MRQSNFQKFYVSFASIHPHLNKIKFKWIKPSNVSYISFVSRVIWVRSHLLKERLELWFVRSHVVQTPFKSLGMELVDLLRMPYQCAVLFDGISILMSNIYMIHTPPLCPIFAMYDLCLESFTNLGISRSSQVYSLHWFCKI